MAPHLGLSKIEVEEVERDGAEEKEKRQKFLEVWKAGFAFKAKYFVLIKNCRTGSVEGLGTRLDFIVETIPVVAKL